jgi:hypothetical protein
MFPMSKTATEIGMIAGGIALALAAGPIGITLLGSLAITNAMIGIGLTAAVTATAGLLNPGPQDPSNIGPQGQLPVQTPNPLWRIIYGIFQFAGAITFEDGPVLNWPGTGSGEACNSQIVNRVHTLACHQIAGFLAVVLDGQTFNFGSDLVLLTAANNNNGSLGPPGMWGFTSNANPWTGNILFAFDCGDPGNNAQPFPFLVAGASFQAQTVGKVVTGSTRWTPSALQRGRAKVHVLIHYSPAGQLQPWGPLGGAPQPYVLGAGRLPIIEFKVAGRIILDYRVNVAWQPNTIYSQHNYVEAVAAVQAGGGLLSLLCIFVQQNAGINSSGLSLPNFGGTQPGSSLFDAGCVWLNCGPASYAAGGGRTALNNPASSKLGGPGASPNGPGGGVMLIADAWQGGVNAQSGIIEAPIGYLQQANGNFVTGPFRPPFAIHLGDPVLDGGVIWTCLGRSKYATCISDPDGTQNQGGFSNPALVLADYLQTPKNEFGLGAALSADSIDTVIAAANICDEPVVIEVFPLGT